MRRALAMTAIALVGAAILASPAAAVTIGSDLKPAINPSLGYGCGANPCTILQRKLPGDPHSMKAPFDGEIRKWRFKKDSDETYKVRLWVVRRTDLGWFFVRKTDKETVGTEAGKYVFSADLKIDKGDYIAVELPPGSTHGIGIEHDGVKERAFFPAPDKGDTADGNSSGGPEKPWNATVKRR